MTGELCGARYARNRAFTCGKLPGHLDADPFHQLDPDDPATLTWLDHDTEQTAPEHGLLTTAEHAVVQRAGELWNAICAAIPEGPTRDADLHELVLHVHAIQQAIMSNAAARAYPKLYRRLGSTLRDSDAYLRFPPKATPPGEPS